MKNKSNLINLAITAGLFIAFAAFTLIVKFVDVQAVGPMDTSVGLATLNKAVADAVGVSHIWYDITNCVGTVVLLIPVMFFISGLVQLMSRKSLKKVDADIYVLGVFYVAVAVCYLAFEHVVINYRPVILDTAPEASYPSSHTMLALCVLATAALQLKDRVESPAQRYAAYGVCFAAALVLIVGRIISGVHWFTDIIGAIMLSASLISAYCTAVSYIKSRFAAK